MFGAIAGRPITETMRAIYCKALCHYDLERIEKGLKTYLREGTGWPWPGTLNEYIENEI